MIATDFLFLGIFLGWKLGLFTVTLYLLEGIAGLPVFAGTPEKGIGLIYFMGPTMGYLLGFLVAVFLTGFFKFSNNFLMNFVKLVFSVSFVFDLGVQPFLLAELFKVLILTLLLPIILRLKN